MAKVETKDLEVKRAAELAVIDQADWGADNVDNKNMLLPRLALMAGTSALVGQDKAAIGDIVNTASGKILADKAGALEIIFVKQLPMTWVISVGGKWDRTELVVPGVEHEWEQVIGKDAKGKDIVEKHERCLNFYVLLKKEMAEGTAMPHLLSFKGSGFKAGQRLVNHFKLSQGIRQSPARVFFKLSSVVRSNDDNTWRVWNTEEAGATTPDEISQAYQWLLKLRERDDNQVTQYEQETEGTSASGAQQFTRKAGEVRANDQF